MTTHTIVHAKGFSRLDSIIKSMEHKNWEVAGIASDDGDFAIIFKKNSTESLKAEPDTEIPDNLDDLAILQGRHFGE